MTILIRHPDEVWASMKTYFRYCRLFGKDDPHFDFEPGFLSFAADTILHHDTTGNDSRTHFREI